MILPGQPITIPDQSRRNSIAAAVCEVIDDREREAKPLFDDLAVWWRNYEALPLQKVKNFPFKGASNIVIPLIQMMVDALVARTWGAMFPTDHRIWTSRTENPANARLAHNMVRYINWQADGNDFSFKLAVHDLLQEWAAIGSSVLAGNWRTEERSVFVRQGRGGNRRIVAQPVRWARGPLLEHVPREQILWDTATPVQEAPDVTRQCLYSWSDLNHMANTSRGWYPEDVEAVQGREGNASGNETVLREKREADSKLVGQFGTRAQPHDVREVHLDFPLMQMSGMNPNEVVNVNAEDFGEPNVYVVATIHKQSRKLLRLVAQPYFVPYKPFFDVFYRKRSGRGHSVGLSKKLEQMQLGMTTIFNQGIDAQTRANSIWAKTNDRRFKDEPIDPSSPVFVSDMASFEPLALKDSAFSNIQLLQTTQAVAERLTGQADVAFGRETRLGGHSAPATTTLALMANADMLNGPSRELLRMQFSRAGEFVASLDQQFETDEDGRIDRILDPEDGELVKGFLFPTEPIPGNYQFNVRGLSQDLNPDTKMNRAVVVSQMNQTYWASILRATQAMLQLGQAQLPPEVAAINIQAWTKFIQSSTSSHINFLEAADVDDIQKFTLSLEGAERDQTQNLRDFADRAAAGAGLPVAGSGQQPVADIPGTNGGGAPSASGAFGGPTVQ